MWQALAKNVTSDRSTTFCLWARIGDSATANVVTSLKFVDKTNGGDEASVSVTLTKVYTQFCITHTPSEAISMEPRILLNIVGTYFIDDVTWTQSKC